MSILCRIITINQILSMLSQYLDGLFIRSENNMNIIRGQSDFGACGQLWLYPACAKRMALSLVLKRLAIYLYFIMRMYMSVSAFVFYIYKNMQLYRTYLFSLQQVWRRVAAVRCLPIHHHSAYYILWSFGGHLVHLCYFAVTD